MSLFAQIRRRRETMRRGAAAVELAICLPLLVLLVMASIEACTMIFLDHSLTIASYEGVRAGINYDGTNADVLSRANAIINSREIQGATVTINPPDVANAQRGETIAVTVSAPCNLNMVIPPWFYDGRTLRATMTMVKE
jgi:Flp pilus assembly protein TadG